MLKVIQFLLLKNCYIHKVGKTIWNIVDLVGKSSSIVKRVAAKFKTSGSIESSPSTHRPLKTSPGDDRVMVRMSLKIQYCCRDITAVKFDIWYQRVSPNSFLFELSVRCVRKTVKFGGGSVMVWRIMSASERGPLDRLLGSMNAEL